ncbi:hypothetical protein Bca4012_019617 [Brassica carinata]
MIWKSEHNTCSLYKVKRGNTALHASSTHTSTTKPYPLKFIEKGENFNYEKLKRPKKEAFCEPLRVVFFVRVSILKS